jgi:lysophospholipase L1-like esterase
MQYISRIKAALAGVCLLCCSFMLPQQQINVFSIGDSTMSDYDATYLLSFGGDKYYPIRGWMQMARNHFSAPVVVHNAARSGRSSRSFRNEGHWQKVIDSVRQGDYVFIMFGANDQKPDTARHTDPRTTYRENLARYINETRAKGAHPVLFTSIVRRKFDGNGKLEDTFGDYVPAMRDLAAEMQVPLVDLYKRTGELVQGYGPEASKALFIYIQPGVFPKLPDGKQDDTHLSEMGAEKVAEAAVAGLKELKLPGLAEYLK